jgi:hypothetical protein
MKNLVMNYDAFSVWRIIGKTELKKLSHLVVDVNYKHHLNQLSFPHEEFEKIYHEDVCALPDSRFYAIYNKMGDIIAAVKCQRWNHLTLLPIEKDFTVDLKSFIKGLNFEPHEVFHIGRFVIDQDIIRRNKDLQQKRLTILKLLMYHALLPVFKNSSNIFFCECDEKLFSKLNIMGLYPKIIGSPKVYIGSKTIPIYCDYSGINKFFQTNKITEYVS